MFTLKDVFGSRTLGAAVAVAAALVAPVASAADLRVTVRQVLAGKGEVLVILFNRPDGFPDKPAATQPIQRVKPEGETVNVTFMGIAEGRWAVMVLQDLNGNDRADYNMVGMPKEPYGASNNRLPKLSAPTFEDALVNVGPQGASIVIELRRP